MLETTMQPLPLGDISATPWAFSPLWFLLVAVAVPALTWLGLAWRRAFEQDPNRTRRAGIRELQRLLKHVRQSRGIPRMQDLHGWCRAAARAWNVKVSAPTGADVARAVQSIGSDPKAAATWRELWRVTERAMFAADGAAPSDWLDRTSSAVSAIEVPRRDRWFPNRVNHWFPAASAGLQWPKLRRRIPSAAVATTASSAAAAIVVTAGLTVMIATGTVRAQEPATSATDTAIAGAEAFRAALPAARDALRKNWNDWAAHYNFAAAQAERGNWNTAAAHASAAFVQNPSSTATRETLRVALEQTGASDPVLRRLIFGPVYQRFPALVSPAGWQRLALVSSLVLAAGLTALVITLYAKDRRLVIASRVATVAGVVLFATACGAWSAYGSLGQLNAGMLYQSANLSPVPTELVPLSETSPATAGTVVLQNRSFLGWQQINAGDKVSGWVRNNAVMPFYGTSRH